MKTLDLAGLRVHTTGPAGAPAVLLCHGYGAPGDDLASFAEMLDPQEKLRWFFPEALLGVLTAEHGVAREKLVIGGFSQGAMLTTDVALRAGSPFAGLVILSGSFLCADAWKPLMAERGAKLRVVQSHGRRDPILPFAAAELLNEALVSSGAQAELVAHDGGHEIPPPALLAMRASLEKWLGVSLAG